MGGLVGYNVGGAISDSYATGAVSGDTAVGGLVGYTVLEQHLGILPYWLTVASSSYIYVALADLIPQLQKRLSAQATLAQIAWLLTGIALVSVVSALTGH